MTSNPYCVDGRSHYGRRGSALMGGPTPLPDLSLPPDNPKDKKGQGCFGRKAKGPVQDDTIYTRARTISASDHNQDKSKIYARTNSGSSAVSSAKQPRQTDWL